MYSMEHRSTKEHVTLSAMEIRTTMNLFCKVKLFLMHHKECEWKTKSKRTRTDTPSVFKLKITF